MGRVTVLILHASPSNDAGPLTRVLAAARLGHAERLRRSALDAGADEVRVVADPPDDTPFGARLRRLARALGGDGVVVLGSGALPLATLADLRRFVAVAASGDPVALANGRYSADVVAIGRSDVLYGVPDLDGDNALPRWLEERTGVRVEATTGWRLTVDIDSPLDVVLAAAAPGVGSRMRSDAGAVHALAPGLRERLRAVAAVMGDRRAELLVHGRTSAATLRWLERHTACRTRALVEERGLRASSPLATAAAAGVGPAPQREPASVLETLLDRPGAAGLGALLGRLCEGALVDTRVLLAARLGRDERSWPLAEDRFASDLLAPDRISDPWLRSLTDAALRAPVPVLLGGHTLVGPGPRLIRRAAG